MNPNKTNAPEMGANNQHTGWEIVEAESGKMGGATPMPEKAGSVNKQESTPEISDAVHEMPSQNHAGEKKEIDTKIISRIDRYLMSSSEDPHMMAHYVADLAGVAAGIKPVALIQIIPTELNLDNAELANMVQLSGLHIADGWENGRFFVSKNPELADKTKKLFQKLWSREITDAEDRDLGRLLGYPETAVAQDFGKPKTVTGRLQMIFRKKENPQLARYYTHSPEHQEEEFEIYERPLHEYLEEHCPRATAVLKEERSSNGRPYRW